MRKICQIVIAGLIAGVPAAHAQGEDELLRRTQMQLRQSEQERNSLRGELARLQAQLDSQASEVEKARQDAAHAQARGAQNSVSNAQLAVQTGKVKQLGESLTTANAELARLRAENARQATAVQNVQAMLEQAQQTVKLRDELIELTRTRNQELYKVGNELVALYRNKDMDSVVKREPVLQIQQVKLQNLMQDFEDRLRAARVFPDTLPPSLEKAMQENMARSRETRSN